MFLRCYATYLAGVKRREEERVERAGPLGKADVANSELEGLEEELSAAFGAVPPPAPSSPPPPPVRESPVPHLHLHLLKGA